MSKFAVKLSRRIMAAVLSLAMAMSGMPLSGMPVHASELPAAEAVEADADGLLQEEEAVADEAAAEAGATTGEKDADVMAAEDDAAKADDAAISDKKNDAGTGKTVDSEDKEETEKSVENRAALTSGTEYTFINKGSSSSAYEFSNYPDFTFDGFGSNISNDHGPQTDRENATIKFTVPGANTDKVNIEVIMCIYNSGTVNASPGTVDAGVDVSDAKNENSSKKYTISDVTGASEVILTILQKGAYVHSIKATIQDAATPETPAETFVAEGSTNFSTLGKEKASTDVIGPINGYTFSSSFKWHGKSEHGICEAGDITLNLESDKTAIITVTGCGYLNSTPEVKSDKGEVLPEKTTANNLAGDNKVAPVYTIAGATGKTKLTFTGKHYIHDITVKYLANNEHLVIVKSGTNGKASVAEPYAAENSAVTLTATPDSGFKLTAWTVTKPASGLTIPAEGENANKFTMPAGDVEVTAVFEAASEPKAITMGTPENGTVTAGTKKTAAKDETVKMEEAATATPNEGYEFKEWKVVETGTTTEVTVTKEGTKYTFVMPANPVTITPVFQIKAPKYFATTYFNKIFAESKKGKPVNDVDGFAGDANVKYNDGQHGLSVGNGGKITLTLMPGKKYDLTVWACGSYGKKDDTTMTATFKVGSAEPTDIDPILEKSQTNEDTNGTEKAPKFTVLKAEGEVVLTLGGGTYIHAIEAAESTAKYVVKLNTAENGTVTADKSAAAAGEKITLTVTPDAGYRLKEWTKVPASLLIETESSENTYSFTMPEDDVTLTPVFEATGTSRSITVATTAENGTAAATEVKAAYSGTKVSLDTVATAAADKGFELYGWKITYKSGGEDKTLDATDEKAGKFSFTMPDADVTITPVFGVAKTVKAGIYNFTQTQKDLLIDGMAFDKFTHAKNVHGCETTEPGASIKLNLEKRANITVTACTYGVGTKAEMASTSGTVKKTTWSEGENLTAPVFNVRTKESGEVTLSFSGYTTGGAGTVWLHSISIEYLPDVVPDVYTDGIDVWDFGAEQLESTAAVKYNNKLTEDIINGWYPGTAAGTSGKNIASFEVKDADGNTDFMFSDGGYSTSHRLRTDNEKLTRYDSKTLTIGDTTYHGYIYDNKGRSKDIYVGVKLNAGDRMTAVVSSNGGAYTITVEDPEGEKQTFAKPTGASVITYYATKSGLHKIYNETDEKLEVARVTREHSQKVAVSGDVTVPSGAKPADITLRFTCRESGEVTEAAVNADRSYEAELYEKYSYDVIALPTTYVITEGKELVLGKANAAQTALHDVKIEGVVLRTVSGKVTGMDAADLKKLQISITKPADKLYQPVIELNAETGAYSMKLENGVEYTMVAEGVNDYELDFAQPNNSDKITVVSDTKKDIVYKKKPVYKITIAPNGAAAADLAAAEFVFTNLNEKGYAYTFTGTGDIKLRDGVYSVKVDKSGAYTQKLTPNLKVDGADVSFAIGFSSEAATEWDFTKTDNYVNNVLKNPCEGLSYSGAGSFKYKDGTYGSRLNDVVITVPVSGSGKVIVTVGYQWNITSGDVTNNKTSGDGGKGVTIDIPYTGVDKVDIAIGSSPTSYIKAIKVQSTSNVYKSELKVGADADGTKASGYDYATINEALAAVGKMTRTAEQPVTISIKPGNYEEMLVINTPNIILKNESASPSLGLRNKGVDIDANAVRITSYYGHGYSYYSMGNDCKWNADVLAVNKANGYESYTNPGSGTTNGSYWNATVVISASNVKAEGIIFENSFNQYVSKKAADDVIVKQGGAKEGKTARASMAYGDTTVQQKEYVERAAALAITDNLTGVMFDNCKFISRQDTLYGGAGAKAAFYNCSVYGGTDYIFGGMTAVFAKCDLVFNTNDRTDSGIKNDVGYITASQTKSGRGYLMYNCHVTSTKPGVDTASEFTSKPGYLGRPWQSATGQAVFYKTVVDEADAKWRAANAAEAPISLIVPAGWHNGLSGESVLSEEFGTYEVAKDVDNSAQRAKWATTHKTNPYESDAAAVTAFLGSWDAFAGKDMTVSLPSDAEVPAPAAPAAIVTPEETISGSVTNVVKGAEIVLSADTGAKIYYTLNAADAPSFEGGTATGTPYAGAIEVKDENIKDNKVTIKAIAVKYGKASTAASFEYTIVDAPKPEAPVFATAEGTTVLLGSRAVITAEQGAAVYYNVNAEAAPNAEATLYTGKSGIEITLDKVNKADSTVKIQAVAVKNGVASDAAAVTYTVKVNAPKPSIKSGYQFPDGGGTIKLSADEDVEILYTTGTDAAGTLDPKTAETGVNTYSKETGISITDDVFIKAVAKRGTAYSDVVALSYRVPLGMPEAAPADGAVIPFTGGKAALKAPSGAKIYYTIGENPEDPTEASALYEAEIDIKESATIKAIAVKGSGADKKTSKLAVFKYTVKVNAPKANPMPVKGQVKADTKITLTSESGTKIYYTQGAVPADTPDPAKDAQGTVAAEANTAEITIGDNTVIKAIAVGEADGKTFISDIAVFEYDKLPDNAEQTAPVTAAAIAGSEAEKAVDGGVIGALSGESVIIKLTSATEGALIYYTMDGSEPTRESRAYRKSITLNSVTAESVIKAVAVKSGMKDSEVLTITVKIVQEQGPITGEVAVDGKAAEITGNAVEVLKDSKVKITLAAALEGAEIRYTDDNTAPTKASALYDAQTGIEKTVAETTVINAVAIKDGYRDSKVWTLVITVNGERPQAVKPEAAVNGSKLTTDSVEVDKGRDVTIELTSATPEAVIRYGLDDETELKTYSPETKITIAKIEKDTLVKALAIKDGFKDSEALTFTIKVKNAGGTKVDPNGVIKITGLNENKTYSYTGAAITPDFSVVDEGLSISGEFYTLLPGIDYTVQYKDNKKPGKATITVIGKGNYDGKSVTESFTISDAPAYTDEAKLADLKGAKLDKIAPVTYIRAEQKPALKIKLKGETDFAEYVYDSTAKAYKKNGADVYVNAAWSGNVNKGTATVYITGKKDAKSQKPTSLKGTFKINAADISKAAVAVEDSAAYAVNGAAPKVTVTYTFGEGENAVIVPLVNGVDYTVKYSNNKKADETGKAKAVITGKGNYAGKIEKTFNIKPLKLSDTEIAAVTACTGMKPGSVKAVVTDGSGGILKASQYTLQVYKTADCAEKDLYDKNYNFAENEPVYVKAAAKDTKNLEGETKAYAFTVGKDISKAKIKLSDSAKKGKPYTGDLVRLEAADLEVKVKVGSAEETLILVADGEEKDGYKIVSYTNNVNKGTATAVIRGTGKYSGTKTIKFKIAAKKMVQTPAS